MRPRLLIGSYLQDDLVARISDEVPEVEVVFRPDLLPTPRFACDHWGVKRELTGKQMDQWRGHLADAEIMFDFDWWEPRNWRKNCPKLTWIQASQAGVGARAESLGHVDQQVRITTAAGVHAKPLAEFALAGLLHFVRQIPEMENRKASQEWVSGSSQTLFGRKALIVGAGSIGREVAKTLSFFGVACDGTTRTAMDLGDPFRHSLSLETCDLARYDIVVLACPLTEATIGMFSDQKISMMKPGALLVNLARGQVIDQAALIEALESGHLGGAVLDVAEPEPLPAGHALWDAPNLILSPHTAANVDAENSRIVELFIRNLRRHISGEQFINLYDPAFGY
ncbi:D-2-hydroxyacid dehydrogenase [Paeniglutamicibacter sp. NPDC012692]|uniref:D-2-hydroxyacid dehydrogenase n=1 Tax=Paeniglutamicibacter sp. NPDC012692 TaxID=3364388 RepID=UPI00369AF3E6